MSLAGKISRSGVLFIERRGNLTEQICPYGRVKNCSHHCPLFGEPFWDERAGCVVLGLCGKVFIMFDRFVDERRKPNKETQEKES